MSQSHRVYICIQNVVKFEFKKLIERTIEKYSERERERRETEKTEER